jgi:spoIIIJ-associated protein
MSGPRTYVGQSLDEALSAACADMRARVGELHYEVVEDGGGGGVKVQAEVDGVAVVGLFLSESFRAGGLDLQVRLAETDGVLEGDLSGADVRFLTGGGGKGLDALQYLANRVLHRRLGEHLPVHLDANGFKERRAESLREQAEDAAAEALRRRAPVKLNAMTPAARREIHVALADDPRVETRSDGEGFLKRVVVSPARRR